MCMLLLQVNGIGCRAVYSTNLTDVDILRPIRPLEVNDCLVDYIYVETIHAGVQCAFAVGILCSERLKSRIFMFF